MAASEMEILAAGLSAITGLNIVAPGSTKAPVVLESGQMAGGAQANVNVLDLDVLHKHTLQWWTGNGAVDEARTPIEHQFEAKLRIDAAAAVKSEKKEGQLQINVRTLTGKTIVLNLSSDTKVGQVKSQVQERQGTDPSQIRLIYHGKPLLDVEATLESLDVADGDTFYIIFCCKGGGDQEPYEISPSLFDHKFDCDFTRVTAQSGENYVRGSKKYIRPYGWNRKALNVKDKYGETSWLGGVKLVDRRESVQGEWPVSYHGTNKDAAQKIVDEGYKVGPRKLYGKGVYSTPYPKIAEDGYAVKFECKGKKYKIILQNRVNMAGTKEVNNDQYFVTAKEKDIRPYGILYKEV
eukprot:Seg8392.1 transcript_id=Seg8392.1/GoldUCD/mRNA.D3Y31 product="Ubiquitin-60S ribosomal protein L40" pseudo=true protein_id=Seg8392.1/GoldUCD/D3Y31